MGLEGPSPAPHPAPLHSGGDAGLRVTLTLFLAGPGLSGSICSSLSVEGEPGKPLGSLGPGPQRQPQDVGPVLFPTPPSQCQAGLGEPPPHPTVPHCPVARMGSSPHVVLLTGAGPAWHRSHRHAGSGGAVGLSGYAGLARNRALCVLWGRERTRAVGTPGKGAQHLGARASSPQAGRGGRWGGAATPGCLRLHRCPQPRARSRGGRARAWLGPHSPSVGAGVGRGRSPGSPARPGTC